jgi:glutamate 5-kinase
VGPDNRAAMDIARPELANARRVVVKVGTAVVTRKEGGLALGRLGALVEEIATLRARGVQVVVVSSGAIGLGAARLGFTDVPTDVVDRQACAAAGQGALVAMWDTMLRQTGEKVAQVLLTEDDFLVRRRYLNLKQTLERLLALGAIPVVNENDTVSTAELAVGADKVFGDNDRLSALVAGSVDADAVVLLTDVDAVYTAPPGTPGAERVSTWTGDDVVLGAGSKWGRGGMAAKIKAAQVAQHGGAHVVIASGNDPANVGRALRGEDVGTHFPASRGINQRRRWIGYATRPEGAVVVNAGARTAIVGNGASLLPAGIVRVEGAFEEGAVVALRGEDGAEFARGLAGCDSMEMIRRVGSSGRQKAVVHRDDVVVLDASEAIR